MGAQLSRDFPQPKPRKERPGTRRRLPPKPPDKTNDWDRDQVHGDGDTIDLQPRPKGQR